MGSQGWLAIQNGATTSMKSSSNYNALAISQNIVLERKIRVKTAKRMKIE